MEAKSIFLTISNIYIFTEITFDRDKINSSSFYRQTKYIVCAYKKKIKYCMWLSEFESKIFTVCEFTSGVFYSIYIPQKDPNPNMLLYFHHSHPLSLNPSLATPYATPNVLQLESKMFIYKLKAHGKESHYSFSIPWVGFLSRQ